MTWRIGERAWVVVAVLTLTTVGIGGTLIGYPHAYAPLPQAVVMPVLLTIRPSGQGHGLDWIWRYAVPGLVGPVLLLAWHPRLLVGVTGYPRRSIVGLVLLSIATAAWFASGWASGVQYKGVAYVWGVFIMNAAALLACWVLAARAIRERSRGGTLLAHWAVVLWLVWLAFPWLGELL